MSGFTLLELIIGFSITVIIIVIAGLFASNVLNFGAIFEGSFETSDEVRQTFQPMITEVRSMAPSNIGSYPLDTAASSSFIFHSDIDEDGLFERVRYFLDGKIFKKGIVKPTGNPLTYNLGNEIITEQIHNIVLVSTSIFSYYDTNYTGSQPPMAFPVNISEVRTIGIQITAQKPNQGAPSSFNAQITPRNLRTNL